MTIPDYLTMTAPATILEATGDKKLPTFSMVAYSGGIMHISGFPHPVVVDMTGLDIPSQNVPIRLDHKSNQGVGHTNRIVIEANQLLAEGLISRDTSWARDVAKSGGNGFPWQASIGGPILEAEFLAAGQTAEVNGQRFEGPIHIVRKMTLREISFVDSGADKNTRAVVSAQAKESNSMTKTKDTPESASASAEPKTIEPASTEPKTAEPATSEPTKPEPPKPPEPPQPPPATPESLQASAGIEDMFDEFRKRIRQTAAEETKHITAIRKICGTEHPEIEAKALEEGWDLTKCELEVMRASRPKAPAAHVPQDQTSPVVLEAVAMGATGITASALERHYDAKTLEAADKLRGIGIQEFCELACGMRLPRYRRDASGWLQAAFSTASLPGILSNLANKMLLQGYNYIEDAWRRICKIATVNDFKSHTRYRMTGNFTFEKVGPDGELKHGKVDEQTFSQQADTHGIMFALTRQMIINDDMGAMTDIPLQIGMGSGESIADAVWELLLSNPVQSDGKAFFHADHKNYAAGADTALSIDALTAAEILFGNQTKPNGRPLGATPRILLVPTALKVAAEQLMTALQVNETTTANKSKPSNNPHAGKFEVVSSTYLSNTSFTGASSSGWYLMGDPNRIPTIEVAFLGGVDRPTVERADADFNTLGIQFRGYIDFGVKEQDYRGALLMKGVA